MKKIITFLTLFFTLILTISGQISEAKSVRKAFDNYKSAILNDQADMAVNFVDNRTIKYYSDILEMVKTADSSKVEALSILDKLMIFFVRHRTPKNDILSMDGKSLLIYAIKSGMVGKDGVAKNSIGELTINENIAKAQILTNEQKAAYYLYFNKEDNLWKIDLTSLFFNSNTTFKKMVEDRGMTENKFIFDWLYLITGKKPGHEIWLPVNE